MILALSSAVSVGSISNFRFSESSSSKSSRLSSKVFVVLVIPKKAIGLAATAGDVSRLTTQTFNAVKRGWEVPCGLRGVAGWVIGDGMLVASWVDMPDLAA